MWCSILGDKSVFHVEHMEASRDNFSWVFKGTVCIIYIYIAYIYIYMYSGFTGKRWEPLRSPINNNLIDSDKHDLKRKHILFLPGGLLFLHWSTYDVAKSICDFLISDTSWFPPKALMNQEVGFVEVGRPVSSPNNFLPCLCGPIQGRKGSIVFVISGIFQFDFSFFGVSIHKSLLDWKFHSKNPPSGIRNQHEKSLARTRGERYTL